MIVQAYFQDIRKHLRQEVSCANSSIYVAVAWFTDIQLFKILCDKAKNGVEVQLLVMDDSITRNCQIDYSDLVKCGGKLFQINESYGTLMHNKFCVIDDNIIITGSYNWSIKAASNFENITITKDSSSLANIFINEFIRIKETYHGKAELKEIDYNIIYKRLEIIINLIQLEEYTSIVIHLHKIKEFELTEKLNAILEELQNERWSNATISIREFLKNSQAVISKDSILIEELKWRIKYLELEIVALENEENIIQKIISDFIHNYTIRFGEMLSKILLLKKEKLKSQGNNKFEEYKKAEEDYANFNHNYEKEKEKKYNELNDEEKEELKKKYRKAATLCHPDAIANKFPNDLEMQKKAEEIFKKLNEANEQNDLHTVSQILENLENGIYEFNGESLTSSNREFLESRIIYLQQKLDTLNKSINQLRLDKTYRQVLNIKDFDVFYYDEEIRLTKELKNLEK